MKNFIDATPKQQAQIHAFEKIVYAEIKKNTNVYGIIDAVKLLPMPEDFNTKQKIDDMIQSAKRVGLYK
ncbi:MAG: hypothetical protein ACRC3J_09160 [Culicoidibacterales bacterium]